MLFPVRDVFGELITFQGRAMFDHLYEGQPKYWHESFNKGEHLYGLYENAPLIVEMGYVVVTEGPFDPAALYECGIPAVAVLGSVFTENHAMLLRYFTDYVFEWLDPDEAGRKAAEKTLKILREWGFKAKSIPNNNDDPSTTLVKEGRQRIIERIQF